jgi:hypothetical protein
MLKLTDVSEVRTAFIIRAMTEAVHTHETSDNFNVTTWRYIPEDSKLQVPILMDRKIRPVTCILYTLNTPITLVCERSRVLDQYCVSV